MPPSECGKQVQTPAAALHDDANLAPWLPGDDCDRCILQRDRHRLMGRIVMFRASWPASLHRGAPVPAPRLGAHCDLPQLLEVHCQVRPPGHLKCLVLSFKAHRLSNLLRVQKLARG